GKRRNACRPTTRHRRKREAVTKTASVKNHTVTSPPKHIGGESVYPYLSEMSYFMRRELKICPHNQNSTAIGRPRSIFSLINQAIN
ncbi:hypothetical protein, partial [uncultured Muribaculum sp.]|uniref:hypothetical protein n=1 Tax=uncultured Muribaculum sp. TaxID=1918613 RepID=UPI00265A97FE